MKISYGSNDITIDVTEICLSKLNHDNIITIPDGDGNRTHYFTDTIFGILKKIFIKINENVV